MGKCGEKDVVTAQGRGVKWGGFEFEFEYLLVAALYAALTFRKPQHCAVLVTQ